MARKYEMAFCYNSPRGWWKAHGTMNATELSQLKGPEKYICKRKKNYYFGLRGERPKFRPREQIEMMLRMSGVELHPTLAHGA